VSGVSDGYREATPSYEITSKANRRISNIDIRFFTVSTSIGPAVFWPAAALNTDT